jgi:dihydrofolate reductase
MRKLVLKMSVSVDGFVGGPNGEIDWLLRTMDKSGREWVEKTLWQAGVHIMGSRTFHDMAAYWPTSSDPLAAPMNEIPKIVFSKKDTIEKGNPELTTQALRDATQLDNEKGFSKSSLSKSASTWTNVPVANDLVADIIKLKQQEGNFILAHGGASFAQELVKHELINEYRLVIHPVILGKGLPLFALAPHQVNLNLESSTSFASGIIANVYTPIKNN